MKRSLLAAAILACTAPLLSAASDYLLEIEGIKGESTDNTHPGAIEISSFSWGLSNAGTTTVGGGGAGKASFQDFHFVCKQDKSSPQLMLRCASGEHIASATLFVRKSSADGSVRDYYKITLTDILVSGFSEQAPPSGGATSSSSPLETVSLNFSTIVVEYMAADSSVSRAGWDLKANTKI